MKIVLPVRPLSIHEVATNKVLELEYQQNILNLLKDTASVKPAGEYFIRYVLYIKNYLECNPVIFEELITDILLQRNFLSDRNSIKAIYLEKISVTDIAEEKIVLDIVSYNDRYKIL